MHRRLSGVWNWRGTNDLGGKTAVADWNDIALNRRRVILAFDGDVARKPSAAKALCALADFLKYRGATVEYLHLPDTDEKTGLDDYLVAGHTIDDLWRLVKPHQPPIRERPDERPQPSPEHNGQSTSTSFKESGTTATAQPRTSSEVPTLARLPRILDAVADEVRVPRPGRRGAAGEDPVSGAHLAAARQAGIRRGQGPFGVGQVLHRRDRDPVLPARGVPRVHRHVRACAGLLHRGVRPPHPRRLRGDGAAGGRRGRHDELLRAVAAVGGPHRLRGHGPRQGRRFHHQEDRQGRPDEPDLHDDQDAGSRGERNPHPVAGHRRLT